MSDPQVTDPQTPGSADPTFISSPPADDPTQSSLSPQERTSLGETKAIGLSSTAVDVGSQLGPYKLVDKLGEGGMGAVYKAQQTRLGRMVALKVLPPHVMSRPDALARFDREMKAVGSLHHPNIVQALDAGEFGGVHYLSMEYVEGQDLQALVKTEGPMSVVNACQAIRQAAQGLAAAHKLGLVHRDIKPSNLFVTKETGQIKILDMGLALLAQEEVPAALTSTGQCFGTPDYMAPEQWNDAHTCDARADLYSLGCTLYFLLVGYPPYHSDTHRTAANKMKGHVIDPIPDLTKARPDAPPGLVAIYEKLMAKRPEDRFASADELAEALALFTRVNLTATLPVLATTSLQEFRKLELSGSANPPENTVTWKAESSGASPPNRGNTSRKRLFAWGGAAAFALLGVIIITITNNDGSKTKIEVPETSKVEITMKGDDATKTGWHGWPADAPKPAIAPFDVEQAKKHQDAWAKYLKVPVEYTNSLGMKFMLIPPGEFMMGSTEEQQIEVEKGIKAENQYNGWADVERPRHRVVLTQPFLMGQTEITIGQFKKFAAATSYQTDAEKADQAARSVAEQPVPPGQPAAAPYERKRTYLNVERTSDESAAAHLSWNDAVAFCIWLSNEEKLEVPYETVGKQTVATGKGYHLPTEAQWEYACRAGTTTLYWYGNDRERLEDFANFRINKVGLKPPNAFGLHDMQGGVWEWCQDWFDEKWYEISPTNDPTGPGSGCNHRVLRGGVWGPEWAFCRSACRGHIEPTNADWHHGIRVVRTFQTRE